jgi:hypothetical protein
MSITSDTPSLVHRHPRRARRARLAAAATIVAAAAATAGSAALAGPAIAATQSPADASAQFAFQSVSDSADKTFNQLLGINNADTIAGYFGSGEKGHPNKGYTLHVTFKNENFMGAAQTQVIGINNEDATVGFWATSGGANHGFYSASNGSLHTADDPAASAAKTVTDQLLGVNDHQIAVGFYADAKGTNHGYTYNIATHSYGQVTVAGDSNVTASGINNNGDIAGFATNGAGATEGFLVLPNGHVVHLNVPGATMTQAFGVNDGDEVVGTYTVGTGNNAKSYGFIWSPGFGFETINDPNGVGATTLNGINDRGQLVGFYTDQGGNTIGLVARPQQ